MSGCRESLIGAAMVVLLVGAGIAQEILPQNRSELKKADLTGTNMEVIISTTETRPGEISQRHFHGEEAFYILEGATIELPDGAQRQLVPGNAGINMRNAAHSGFKVVGDRTLKLLTVHIVDKGKPLYNAAK